MTISGFSFVRNAVKLYYPIREAIESILPICDEFVVAVGRGDPDDTTRDEIASINDPKVKIIDTVWDQRYCKRGAIHAQQTDLAKSECSGDWCFYLQGDEVVHEDDHENIVARCEELVDDERVEGLLFDYLHFWGDYDHYHTGHGWYPHEIRIVRNDPSIHSWESAQSFRRFDFYEDTHQKEGTHKLKVAKVDARIFHYGWVRPPHLMQNKSRAFYSNHWGSEKANQFYDRAPDEFDYGPLDKLGVFEGTHPKVMQDRIKKMNWKQKLQYSGKPDKRRQPHKHEKPRVKMLSWIENTFNRGRQIGTFHNYELLKNV